MKNAAMTKTAYSMLCAFCIALTVAVQLVFSGFRTDCAVYFSVFLCAVCCPLRYGIFCAVLCPVIAMMTAMSPSATVLPAEMAKCLVFVLTAKLLLGRVRTGKVFTDLYICLVPAVCTGQIVDAVICSAIFCGDGKSAILFVIEKLIAAIPDAIFLLAVTPGVVILLKNLGMAEEKPPKNNKTENSV